MQKLTLIALPCQYSQLASCTAKAHQHLKPHNIAALTLAFTRGITLLGVSTYEGKVIAASLAWLL